MADISIKLDYWKNRLLDLGKRNRLINCPLPSDANRIQRHSLLISIPDANDLWTRFEDAGTALSFPVPTQLSPDDNDEQLSVALGGIKTNQTANETYKTLRSLMKKAKEFSEEKGLNALHLAFGFLDWKENGDKGQDMRSPLLLVPVTLTQDDLFSPILLVRDDEEISPNHSLSQKLYSDFGIELPPFIDGSDLGDYLSGVRNTVKSLGWSVPNDIVQLSLFSFMKINMYRDLERNGEKINANRIVRALNGEILRDGADVSNVSGYNHDINEPQEVFSVVDADSSQQDAILLAKRGASFVLQGPPGTGKSQTITNIIAELIADGKKVLFVSEKMAALEVVYKRLSQAGIGDFCLTLHSHNAKRREVLDQLEKSIKRSRTRAILQQDAFSKLYSLKDAREKLNQYNTELHTVVEPFGKTIFQVYGYLAQLEDFPNIDYVQSGADAFTPERISQCENALVEVTRIILESGYQQNNPWNGCVLTTPPTFEFKQRFVVDAEVLLNQLNTGIMLFSETNAILGTQIEWKCSEVADLRNIYDITRKSPTVPSSWISLDLSHILQLVETCVAAVKLKNQIDITKERLDAVEQDCEEQTQKYNIDLQSWQNAHNELISENNDGVLALDAQTMLGLYRESYRTWLRGFIAGYRKSQRLLNSYRKSDGKLSYEDGLILLDKIVKTKSLKAAAEQQENILGAAQKLLDDCRAKLTVLEGEYATLHFDNVCRELCAALKIEINASFDFGKLKMELLWCEEFEKYVTQYAFGTSFIESVCTKANIVFDRIDKNINAVNNWFADTSPSLDKFIKIFTPVYEGVITARSIGCLAQFINVLKNSFAHLEHLIDYRNAERQLETLGIDSYLLKAKELNLQSDEIIPVFKKCFFRSWLDAVMPKFSAVNEFRRLRQDERVAAFKELDKTHLEISKAMLITRLISRLPNFDAFAQSGELALLRRELAKQRKLMPIRRLIAALPNFLPELKPCMLMSPLSVSTYLGDSNYEFDTVIFDEASQVRTEDAIGAIFRAKQAIIAGDSKQLPPTDFFTSSMSVSDDFEEDEDGEIDDTGAYESLLDEATLLPAQTLLWHYRSRHEHLIAFSNAKIYGGNLITFPSSVEKVEGMGVEYIYVTDGRYISKNGNKSEATRVAELVFEHFSNYPDRSLGIIAFGEVQQSAILDALIEKRRANPTFEPFFKEDRAESLFVKNLETVQGDERDTIIFSIGYAPDQTGKFAMRFGPLSMSGGERRLNVAVTRARYNLKLVGSILPTDIASERVSGEGPKLLRLYIDFAMNGATAIFGEITANDELQFDSPFEASVYNFLTANGFEVATQVGCSGYRIDLGVRHPQYNGRFAIGIECDGAMYHSARTARERDRLRQTVLEDMGWNIYRIWSTDWIKDRQTEGSRLIEAVKKSISEYREIASNATHIPSNMATFLNVNTVSIEDSIREGVQEKFNAVKSRYYGYKTEEVPYTDFDATMLKVLANNFGLDKAGLFKETAQFGYGWLRQGQRIKTAFETAYSRLFRNGKIAEEADGKIKLLI